MISTKKLFITCLSASFLLTGCFDQQPPTKREMAIAIAKSDYTINLFSMQNNISTKKGLEIMNELLKDENEVKSFEKRVENARCTKLNERFQCTGIDLMPMYFSKATDGDWFMVLQ